ncbi:MAG TPA: NAD(P)H-hydrate epimerase [Tepidiformaceae bacterium]|nr:NAD(P)H-hydrate epimerase [Tepidiformaceae bacterium]
MRDVQRVALEEFGFDILQITENGARAAASLGLAMLGAKGRGQRVVMLCGGGNKGATGLAAARHLANFGFRVDPVLGVVEEDISFTARRQIQILREAGILEPADLESTELTLEDQLAAADLVVDALVGYGLEGPPTGIAAAITELVQAAKRPVLALDVPTGVNATTGEVSVPAIRATTTLMLDLPKVGVMSAAARANVGELYIADIGIPRAVHERLGLQVGDLFSEGPLVRLRR